MGLTASIAAAKRCLSLAESSLALIVATRIRPAVATATLLALYLVKIAPTTWSLGRQLSIMIPRTGGVGTAPVQSVRAWQSLLRELVVFSFLW